MKKLYFKLGFLNYAEQCTLRVCVKSKQSIPLAVGLLLYLRRALSEQNY